jgi:uncharacterized protein
MFAYNGSTAMITGASKGLGAAFTKELAGRGMNLVLVARSFGPLQDIADSLGAQHGVRCVGRVPATSPYGDLRGSEGVRSPLQRSARNRTQGARRPGDGGFAPGRPQRVFSKAYQPR